MKKSNHLKVILLGSILASSSLMAASQSSQQPSSQVSQPQAIGQVVVKAVQETVFVRKQAQSRQHEANQKTQYVGLKDKLHRTAGPGTMFRRVVNAPSAGGGRQAEPKSKPSVSTSKVRLVAKMPSGFSSKDVQWFIKAKDGSLSKKMNGSGSSVSLPAGKKYTIKMKVGKYTQSKTVKVSGSKTVNFTMKGGKIKVSAAFSGGVKDKVRFDVYALKNGKKQKKVITVKSAYSISKAVPPGDYLVIAKSGSASVKKKISVAPGKTRVAKLTLPASTVTLMAKKADKVTPFMEKTTWQVYKKGHNKPIASASRHTAKVRLPAGSYVAKAKSANGTWKITKFTVTPGASKRVKLAME
jgi:hypothetical protein